MDWQFDVMEWLEAEMVPEKAMIATRARTRPKVLLKPPLNETATSCGHVNIIVIIMNLWNCRFSVKKSKDEHE
jgi:hypothetical protein